jgi:hypothetical protein
MQDVGRLGYPLTCAIVSINGEQVVADERCGKASEPIYIILLDKTRRLQYCW